MTELTGDMTCQKNIFMVFNINSSALSHMIMFYFDTNEPHTVVLLQVVLERRRSSQGGGE